MFWLALVDAPVARSMEAVLGMMLSLFVRVCGCTGSTWNSPSARVSGLFYVTFTIVLAEFVAAAESGGRSINTM